MVKLGLIGYNEGNGHPYSFSAIINGYNESAFSSCPYPMINNYLKARQDHEFGIGDFSVSHVWTPFRDVSASIASYANIEHIVDDYQNMIGKVDAVIIARDDAETHRSIAFPFLNAGIKVFIDKPLCKTSDDLEFFKPFLKSGQLMSCSGLRFYPAIVSKFEGSLLQTDILFCHCVAPMDWFKYGIHVLEGVTPLLGSDIEWVQNIGEPGNDIVRIQYKSGRYAIIQVVNEIGGGLRTSVFLKAKSPLHIQYDNNFSCFRQQLIHFYRLVVESRIEVDPYETIFLIKALIAGDRSRATKERIAIV